MPVANSSVFIHENVRRICFSRVQSLISYVKLDKRYLFWSKYWKELDNFTYTSFGMLDSDSIEVGYTINRGDSTCVQLSGVEPDGRLNYIPINACMHILIHELVHIAAPTHGHPPLFWDLFGVLLLAAVEVGVYNCSSFPATRFMLNGKGVVCRADAYASLRQGRANMLRLLNEWLEKSTITDREYNMHIEWIDGCLAKQGM